MLTVFSLRQSQPPMANFYYGILKYVYHSPVMDALSSHNTFVRLSTGKRRYGHPALNGILPQPWLPLKKGQTLANFIDHDVDESDPSASNGAKKRNGADAVVLTLRRKYTVLRKDVGRIFGNNKRKVSADGVEEETRPMARSETSSINPWRDAAPGPSRPVPSASYPHTPHRMSFDQATGIIMLPDDEDWMEDPMASDSDDLNDSQTPTPERETPEPGAEAEGGTHRTVRRRHSTYYHHPERRRTVSTPLIRPA